MQYGVVGSGITQTMSVSGASVTKVTVLSLMSSTTYSIQVAAVNSAGVGVHSDLLIVHTEGKCLYHHFVFCVSMNMRVFLTNIHVPHYSCIPQSQ